MTIIFSLLLAFVQDASSCVSIFSYHYVKAPEKFKTQIKSLKKVVWLLLIAAICAGPLGMVAGIAGISYAGPIYAGVITSCYPVVALILAIIFLKERPAGIKIIGIIISVIAVISISLAGEHTGGKQVLVGIMFATCAMLGWGLESILLSLAIKKGSNHDSSFLLATRQFCSAMSYVICLIVIYFMFPVDLFTMFKHFFMLKMLLICSLLAMLSYIAYYNAIKRIGASLGTTFNATFIFWAGVFSIMFNITVVTLHFVIWGVVLIFGIYLATQSNKSKHKYSN